MRNIRIQSIIIMLCIMLTISCKAIADNNESLNEHEPISFNSIDSCYTRLYYMPTLEEALSRLNERNEALSRLEMRLNVRNEDAHGITTVSLSLNQYDEGWRVSKVFYSKDSNQLVILYALVYGDDTGIYGLGIPFPYTEYEVFMRNLTTQLSEIFKSRITSDKSIPQSFSLDFTVRSFAETIRWWLQEHDEYTPEQIVKFFSGCINTFGIGE